MHMYQQIRHKYVYANLPTTRTEQQQQQLGTDGCEMGSRAVSECTKRAREQINRIEGYVMGGLM